MPPQLHQVGLVDLLNSDPRPTFVAALSVTSETLTVTRTDEPSPQPPIVYANPSFKAYPNLLDRILSGQQEDHGRFWKWISTESAAPKEPAAEHRKPGASSFWYLNLLWTKTTINALWAVVGANEEPPSSVRIHKMLQPAGFSSREPDAPEETPTQSSEPSSLPPPSKPGIDLSPALTSYLDQDQLAFIDGLKDLDWAATPLGPISGWAPRLRQIFHQIITDTHPVAIYWGEHRVVVYNHAFSTLCGSQHPFLLGKPARDSWPDNGISPQSPIALFSQRNEWSTVQNEATIFVPSVTGALLETHINSSITPIVDAGDHVGFLQSLQDITASRLWERRMNMLCDLSDTLLTAQDTHTYWEKVLEGLEAHSPPFDIPLAILYSVDAQARTVPDEKDGLSSSITCHLQGSLGVPAGHTLIPDTFNLEHSQSGLAPKFREVFNSKNRLFLQNADGSLPPGLLDGIVLRGFGDKCSTAVICPIRPTKRAEPLALLLLGLNPRRPYDKDYERYVSLLNQKLSAYLASAMLLEGPASEDQLPAYEIPTTVPALIEAPAAQPGDVPTFVDASVMNSDDESMGRPAEQVRDSIGAPTTEARTVDVASMVGTANSAQTAASSMLQAHEMERLQRMTELVTVGICETDLDGRLIQANKVFFELCCIPRVQDLTTNDVRPWETCVPEEARAPLLETLSRLVKDGMPQTTEVRLNSPWITQDTAGNEIQAPRWILATFMPVQSSDGTIHSIHGCFSDVSAQKWQLEIERLRKEEALESKRQQENFMDMTSHEMRNPLGAIIHCADAILASLNESLELTPNSTEIFRADGQLGSPTAEKRQDLAHFVTESIENAETIIACAQHQKRIIDDLLTVSKLDSKLIAVTPCTVDPLAMVKNAMKMFEVEAKREDVDLKMAVDQSYMDLGYEYFDFDPSRAKQVLINLLTNALKFTKNRPVRKVSVLIKASKERPTDESSCVRFMPKSFDEPEYPQPELIGRTDPLYLIFEVRDSGRGLSEDEMRHLFNRFQQANSFTHVKHGGSGLGLFISRRLTELQNGAIGVSSMPKSGSTFAFFIEAYRPSETAVMETALATLAPAPTTESETQTPGSGRSSGHASPRRGSTRAPSIDLQQGIGGNGRLDGILIVEDNTINQQITQRGLSHRGFRVDVANHGLEALEKLDQSKQWNQTGGDTTTVTITTTEMSTATATATKAEATGKKPIPFNLVLMDIEMPVQDGLTCARKIRELEMAGTVFCASGGRIPIIAVSAHAKETQVVAALGAGCDDVLVKPYRMTELIEKMQTVVRRVQGLSPSSPPPEARQ